MGKALSPRYSLRLVWRLLFGSLAVACAGAREPVAQVANTPRPPSQEGKQVAAVFVEAGCRECHSTEGAASDTRLIFPRNGATAAEVEKSSAEFWQLVDATNPSASRLLRKPTKRVLHEGGERIAVGSEEEKILLGWLTKVGGAGPRDLTALREVLVSNRPSLNWPVRYRGRPSLVRRLSRDELIATLELLVGAAPARSELPDEPREGHGPLVTAGVSLLANEIRALQVVMKDFAAKNAPKALETSGCALADEAQRDCLEKWAIQLLTRAFRRAPSVDEAQTLRKMFAGAGVGSAPDTVAVEVTLSAIFLSPSFLYREEQGSPIEGKPTVRALRAYEIASRLSFFSTLTPPDALLLAAAESGKLAEGAERVRQFDRLAATEGGRKAQAIFVLEWLGANDSKINLKSNKYQKDLGKNFESRMRTSAVSAIEKVLFESADPTVGGLLSTKVYLNDDGIESVTKRVGDGNRVAGDNEQTGRMGLMMHPQIVAAHTKENGSSPFQLGSFMREALLCEPVPAPPVDAAASARTDEPPGLSTRESLEFKTSAGRVCTGCHMTFAPLGYSFLPFDPIGRWVQADPTGKPWNLAGSVPTSSGLPLQFGNPAQLMHSLAQHPQVHGCFAQAALQWILGRQLVHEDEGLVIAVNEVAKRTRGNLGAIFRAIVAAPGFATVVAPSLNAQLDSNK